MLTDELRTTFLFEKLSAEQLEALEACGKELIIPAGETIFEEGQPADFLWVLLDGEVELARLVGGQRIVVEVMTRPGTYAGGVRAFAASDTGGGYRATGRALRDTRFFQLSSRDLSHLLDEWLPMAKHLLDGYTHTFEAIEVAVRERSHLISLGTLAAGLAHELNNPAAAARSTAADLRTVVDRLLGLVQWFAQANLTPERMRAVLTLQSEVTAQPTPPPRRSAIETGELEEEVGLWLEEHAVANAWEIAPTFVAAGRDVAWLDTAARRLGADDLSGALTWVADTLLATSLLDQIDDATGRISQLVSAVKDYTYMDRAPEQEVDIHEGIEKTLVILGHKLRGNVEVIREYESDLPRVLANGGELNQVWTNLIDNAIDAMNAMNAMNGHGHLRIRTRHEGQALLVEIADDGPGISDAVAQRMFEPFFTTKEVGKGTGLGLDIVRRIVVDQCHGEVTFESAPGDTRFLVRLPLAPD